MLDSLRSHPVIPERDYASSRELVHTACGRRVLRLYVDGYHRYQLLEPVLVGVQYGETLTDETGLAWGVARTRRPAAALADYDAQLEHELGQARRAVKVMRATVEELQLRDANGRPGGVSECIFVSRGDVILLTDPAGAARRVRDQRGGR